MSKFNYLHHVMDRGIDGIKIFSNRKDREKFLERLADLLQMSHTFSV